MKQNGIVSSALILTGASLITRLLGFFYRIYMSQTIGAEGMGLYQLILPLYMLAWTITASGFTTTVSRLAAQENAKGRVGNTRRLLKISVVICGCLGLALGLALFLFARPVALYLFRDTRALPALKILGLAFPWMAMGSCIRGYFHGMRFPRVPAISQILEQAVRLVTVGIYVVFFRPHTLEQACVMAVAGIITGEVVSFGYVLFAYFRCRREFSGSPPSFSRRVSTGLVLSMALPLTANRVTGSVLSTAENILIPRRLALFDSTSGQALATYGRLTGMAMPLIQLPSALLLSISISLVPALSEAMAIHDQRRVDATIQKALFLTSMIAMGGLAVFLALPEAICRTVYHQPDLASIVRKLSLVCPFLYMQITLSGILNGLGQHTFLLKNSILSSFINIGFIYFFMPVFGVDAFLAGWLCSLVVTGGLSLHKLASETRLAPDWKAWLLRPLFCAGLSAVAGRVIFDQTDGGWLGLIVSIAFLACTYVVTLALCGCIDPRQAAAFRKK